MQKKIIVAALGMLVGSMAFAQQPNVNQAQPAQPVANPADRVVIAPTANIPTSTPPQASNPYGTVQTPGAPSINYQPQVNGINGQYVNVPASIDPVTGLPNPVAAQQMGVPNQLPTGLPQDATYRTGGQMDAIENTINILNTESKRIREINRELHNKGRVLNETPTVPAKAVNGVLTASIAPGAISPVIRLARNRTSAIIITDATGQPWPIINYDGLSEEDFTVKRLDNPSPDGYVLSVTPKGAFVNGNLVVILKGLPSPLSIDFVSAQKEVDVKTEIRVQARGPNTQFTSIGLPDSMDTGLLSILQGVPPQGAKELKVSSNAVQAWLAKDGKMYVRTRYKVMSPAFENVSSSPDGTYAYKMVPVPVVLYKANEGRFGEFHVSGF